jgi:hypothetical protein
VKIENGIMMQLRFFQSHNLINHIDARTSDIAYTPTVPTQDMRRARLEGSVLHDANFTANSSTITLGPDQKDESSPMWKIRFQLAAMARATYKMVVDGAFRPISGRKPKPTISETTRGTTTSLSRECLAGS